MAIFGELLKIWVISKDIRKKQQQAFAFADKCYSNTTPKKECDEELL